MTYEPLGLRRTHGILSLGLSTLAIYRNHNTTTMLKLRLQRTRVGVAATEDKGWRGADIVMMALGLYAARTPCHKGRSQGSPDNQGAGRKTISTIYWDRTSHFTLAR
jgi:hypothetical protein